MRKTDYDFAKELLTQAELNPEDLASTSVKGLMVTLADKRTVNWTFDEETGEFFHFGEVVPI